MSQMNILPMDTMQATDNSSVKSNASLGGWNESSDTFAELINQHQQEHGGKNNPLGGKASDKKITPENSPSYDVESQSNEIDPDKNSQALEDTENASTDDIALTSNKAEDIQNTGDTEIQKEQHVSHSEAKESEASTIEDSAEHLKLLALLTASEEVSTEHTSTDNKRMQTSEEAKLAKILTEMQGVTENAKKSKTIEQLKGEASSDDKASITLKPFDIISKVHGQEKGVSENVETEAKLMTHSDDSSNDSSTEQKKALSSAEKSSISVIKDAIDDSKTLSLSENKKGDEKALAENGTFNEKVAEDNQAQQKNKGINAVADSPLNKNAKDGTHSKVEQLLVNEKQVIENDRNISGDVEKAAVIAKNTEINQESIKEVTKASNKEASVTAAGVLNKAINTSAERINLVASGSNNETLTEQKNINNPNQFSNIVAKQAVDSELSQDKQQESESQQIEQEVAVNAAELKQALATPLSKENTAFKPVDTNLHHNIHSTSFVRAEEQAAAQVIEKSVNDTVDAMTQKKTLNVHNETIAIYRKDFNEAVKDKVMLMINQKLQQVEIRLDPPELGSLYVKVNLQNEQAAVSFIVQNQQAKDALDQSMAKLKDMLAQSGVDVGEANVEQQQQQTNHEQAEPNSNSHNSRNLSEQEDTQSLVASANLYKSSTAAVDYYA
ncbi:MAG: flagellar hook-length control protein FliK [Thalassotalea sp.]